MLRDRFPPIPALAAFDPLRTFGDGATVREWLGAIWQSLLALA
jgi:hypothetical protein